MSSLIPTVVVVLSLLFGFSIAAKHYIQRIELVCGYVSTRPEVADGYRDLVKEPDGCEIFVKSQRAKK
jgi:hypothetical protein